MRALSLCKRDYALHKFRRDRLVSGNDEILLPLNPEPESLYASLACDIRLGLSCIRAVCGGANQRHNLPALDLLALGVSAICLGSSATQECRTIALARSALRGATDQSGDARVPLRSARKTYFFRTRLAIPPQFVKTGPDSFYLRQ
jgi:hypothetical protein